jgi:hypothetical protein
MDLSTSRFQLNQNGLYLLGQSAIDEANGQDTILRNISTLNQRMLSSKAMSESFDFGNGVQVSTKQMVDETIGGVFDTSALERYGFGLQDSVGINYELTDLKDKARLRGFLSEEGIQVSDTKLDKVKNFIALDPKAYKDPGGIVSRGHITPFHEIGHTGSRISGLGNLADDFLTSSVKEAENFPGGLTGSPLYDRIKSFFTYMALQGKEEARAEGFGIYAASTIQDPDEWRLSDGSRTSMISNNIRSSVRGRKYSLSW